MVLKVGICVLDEILEFWLGSLLDCSLLFHVNIVSLILKLVWQR